MCTEYFFKTARKERVALEGVPPGFTTEAATAGAVLGGPAPAARPLLYSKVEAAYAALTRHPRFANGTSADNLFKRAYEARCARLQVRHGEGIRIYICVDLTSTATFY